MLYDLKEHQGEVISIDHNYHGDQAVTSSFDKTAIVWDLKSG
jgi:WD40 repeat protein